MDKPAPRREIIKVIAVGGGGGNALNHIISKGLDGVEFLAVNTDKRSLDMSQSKNKIVLGERITGGLGAGSRPEIGERAAIESLDEVRAFLKGADMVYFAAGMGGGTGTGALPVLAAAAKDMGILTVAVVTKPFSFEGGRRMRYAENGINKLRSAVDALIVVPNDRLLDITQKGTSLPETFAMADEVLRMAVVGVTDLVTKPGMVHVDFADLRTVMRRAGPAVMGVGIADGEDRVAKAIEQALESPLMECSMHGAKGVLMNITCGTDLALYEVREAAAYIEEIMAEDATFVWGCVEDDEMDGQVEIVVVATGFDSIEEACEKRAYERPKFRAAEPRPKQQAPTAGTYEQAAAPEPEKQAEPHEDASEDEKPRLISETLDENAPAWVFEESGTILNRGGLNEQRKGADTSEFDAPSYRRRKRGLKDR